MCVYIYAPCFFFFGVYLNNNDISTNTRRRKKEKRKMGYKTCYLVNNLIHWAYKYTDSNNVYKHIHKYGYIYKLKDNAYTDNN